MYNSIKNYLAEDWTAFEKQFKSSLVSSVPLMQKINNYLLEHKGKQLRPLLTILAARALKGLVNENVIRCAASAEILHMATLIHDDVADDSDLRRGNPTVMALYNPTTAVLVGDFWLSRAIEDITRYCERRILLLFSRCLQDLAEGEIFQLAKIESMDMTFEDYRHVIYCKTASLFKASILSGAYCVDASAKDCDMLGEYAFHLGIAFQMMDDIMDYDTAVKSGKPAYQDIAEHKITLPLLCSFDAAAPERISKVKELMKRGEIKDVVAFIRDCHGIDRSYEVLNEEVEMTKNAISGLDESPEKDFLLAIADSMKSRIS